MAKKKKKVRKARRAPKRPAKKAKKSKPKAKAKSTKPKAVLKRWGWITHTELVSANPDATKAWCAKVLGWNFKASFPTPEGPYHMFEYSEAGGGGIRRTNPGEPACSMPYLSVPDVNAAFAKALSEGAEAMLPPERVMEGVSIALVRAPGGVPIGFSGP